jgi:hypothetical protein
MSSKNVEEIEMTDDTNHQVCPCDQWVADVNGHANISFDEHGDIVMESEIEDVEYTFIRCSSCGVPRT